MVGIKSYVRRAIPPSSQPDAPVGPSAACLPLALCVTHHRACPSALSLFSRHLSQPLRRTTCGRVVSDLSVPEPSRSQFDHGSSQHARNQEPCTSLILSYCSRPALTLGTINPPWQQSWCRAWLGWCVWRLRRSHTTLSVKVCFGLPIVLFRTTLTLCSKESRTLLVVVRARLPVVRGLCWRRAHDTGLPSLPSVAFLFEWFPERRNLVSSLSTHVS